MSCKNNYIDIHHTPPQQQTHQPHQPIFRSAVFSPTPSLSKTSELPRATSLKRLDAVASAQALPKEPSSNNNNRLVIQGGWSVSCLHVEDLPFYHLLDDPHRSFDGGNLEKVVMRLMEVFQLSSFRVQYEDGQEESGKCCSAKAVCTTLDNIEFVVVLWKRNNEHIAEVQRTKGCSMAFLEHSRKILDAVDGNDAFVRLQAHDPLDVDSMDMDEECHTIATLFTRCVSDKNLPLIEADIQQSIAMVVTMLLQQRYDALRTGLESLQVMTSVRASGPMVARAVALVVLNNTTQITNTVCSLASNGEAGDLECAALTILGQSANLVDANVLQDFCLAHPHVVHALLEGAVHANTHIAYLSTHLLGVLHNYIGRDAIRALPVKHLQLVGSTSHAALASASERLMRCIQQEEYNMS